MKQDFQLVKFGRDYGLKVDDMPAQLSYFFVYPFCRKKLGSPEMSSIRPIILTYKGDDTLLKELMADLQSSQPCLKKQPQCIFTLSNGYQLDEERSVAWLQKKILKKRLDGLVLFVKESEKKSKNKKEQNKKKQTAEDDQPQEIFNNQCCILEYAGLKELSQNFDLNINFNVPGTEYVLSFEVKTSSTIGSLVTKFLKELERVFKIQLKSDDILKIKVKSSSGAHKDLPSDLNKTVGQCDLLLNNTSVDVEFKKKTAFKLQVASPDKRIIIYKENSSNSINQCFEEVEFMTFKTLYERKLEGKKPLKDGVRCLKVMDTIIKENQNLSKLSGFFQGCKNDIIQLVGRVVSEKMYFYKHVGQLSVQNFKIEDKILPKNQKEQPEVFRQKIRSNIKLRTDKSDNQHFKNQKNVEPIYIYTCEETHNYQRSEDGNQDINSEPIYQIVNRHLREMHILEENDEKISQDWRNSFTSSLISQLSKIEDKNYERTVYRGINFDLKGEKGDVITFKSFTSTSTSKNQAWQFLIKPLSEQQMKKNPFSIKVMVEMKIRKSGKKISNFSDIPNEEEILLLPYTQFKVLNKEKKYQEKYQQSYTFIQLEQIDQKWSSSKYPETKAHFIIWVDDKLEQGKLLYKTIQVFQQPTLLIQLTSTKQLTDWLSQQKNQKLILDPTANFALITNMTREGNGQAGIEAIIQLQKYTKEREMPTFLYIFDKLKAKQKLLAHKQALRNVENIGIGNNVVEVQDFLKKTVKISFEVKQQEQQSKKEPNPQKLNSQNPSNANSQSKNLLKICQIM